MFWQLLCGLMLGLGGGLLIANGDHTSSVYAMRLGGFLMLAGGGVLGMLFQKLIGGFGGKKKETGIE